MLNRMVSIMLKLFQIACIESPAYLFTSTEIMKNVEHHKWTLPLALCLPPYV